MFDTRKNDTRQLWHRFRSDQNKMAGEMNRLTINKTKCDIIGSCVIAVIHTVNSQHNAQGGGTWCGKSHPASRMGEYAKNKVVSAEEMSAESCMTARDLLSPG